MAKVLEVAIIRIYEPGNQATAPTDQACMDMLDTNANGRAVLDYWRNVTGEYVDFNVTLFPWIQVQFTSDDVNVAKGCVRREKIHVRAVEGYTNDAVANHRDPPDFTRFQGFILLVWPGISVPHPVAGQPNVPFDPGYTSGCAVYPLGNPDFFSHSFMCHEIGHMLGLFESEGLFDANADTSYGDPFDIMSAREFGGTRPVFAGPVVPGWPNVTATQEMGPAPSLAELHYWDKDVLPPSHVRELVVTGNDPHIQLAAAYGNAGVPRLLVVRQQTELPNAFGRCYVEYRDTRGPWDLGLSTSGPTLARQGVVIHVVWHRAPDIGAGDTTGMRTWYRGCIPIPVEVDSDQKVTGTPYIVRVVDYDVKARRVELAVTWSTSQGIEIVRTGAEVTALDLSEHEIRHTPCGDTLHWGYWKRSAVYKYRPITWGFGGEPSAWVATPPQLPMIQWTVGGVKLGTVGSKTTAFGCEAPAGKFNVDYEIDPASMELTLTSHPGDVFTMPVSAEATHPVEVGHVTAQSTLQASGSDVGYPPGDMAKIARCLAKVLSTAHQVLPSLPIPHEGPRPNWGLRIDTLANNLVRQGPTFATQAAMLKRLARLDDR